MRERILVVEDDEFLRDTLQTELELAGYQVTVAADALAAIERSRQEPFDLIVTDVRLPGMDGLQALSRMRELQPQARSIVITGFADPQAPVTAIKLKVDDYLQKPFTADQFLASVKVSLEEALRALRRQRSARRLEDLLARVVAHVREAPDEPLLDEALGRARRQGWPPQRRQLVQMLAYLRDLDPSALEGVDELQGLARTLTSLRDPAGVPATAEARLLRSVLLRETEAEELGEDATPWQVLQLAEVYRETGQFDVARQALEALPAELSLEQQLAAGLGWARLHLAQGQLHPARQQARLASELARPLGWTLARAQAALLLGELGSGDAAELEGARDYYLRAELPVNVLWADLWRVAHGFTLSESVPAVLAGLAAAGSVAAYDQAARVLSDVPFDLAQAPLPLLERMLRDGRTDLRLKVVDALAQRGTAEAQALLEGASRGGSVVALKSGLALGERSVLEVRLFGQFTCALECKTSKTRNLFAYLCLHRGKVHSEDVLVDAFWPHSGPSARHSLHNSISQLRKALGDASLVRRSGTGYVLERSPALWIDYEQFLLHCEAARPLLARGDAREGAAELRQAEELYRGDLLEGVYEGWTESRRLEAQTRLLDLLATLARYYHKSGRPEVALEYWRKIVQRDDCSEEAYHGMMVGYAHLGKSAEAVRVYQQAAQTLRQQLNLAPSPQMTQTWLKLVDGQSVDLEG